LLLGIVLCAPGSTALDDGSTQIDGVLVRGRWHGVLTSELREAVKIAIHDSDQPPFSIDVIDREHMQVWAHNPEMGWAPLRYVRCCIPQHWDWDGLGIANRPDVLRFVRTASEAYVFPLPDPLKPHLDRQRMRRLDAQSQHALAALIGDESNWWHGMYELFGPEHEPPSIGFVFKEGPSELVLFVKADRIINGTFNGEHQSGLIDDHAVPKLKAWEHLNAAQEIDGK
jgi:hypothetical protein